MKSKPMPDSLILIWLVLLFVIEALADSRTTRRRNRGGWMSGTKPPGAPCTFDPCDVEDFCDKGRRCVLDDSCKHHCECTDQSTHESCVKSSTATVKPEITSPETPKTTTTKVTCAFNPCNIEDYCGGGRECELDDSCRHHCVCTDQSTHESCVRTSTAITTSKTTTTKITCMFNPCSIDNFCGGGRKCEIDDSCRHKCVCTDESFHESCVTSSTSTKKPDVTSPLTSKKTTTMNCVFNPCTVRNFCGEGRRCEIDHACKHKCICLDNFTHDDCKRTHSTTTPSVVCAFNPCSTPGFNFCGAGRRCDFDQSTCKHECVCLDNFTHDNCKPFPPTTTASPDDDKTGRNCPPGFPCMHGYCEQPGFKCVCDEGWTGVFCDKDLSSNCTRECEDGLKCIILPDFSQVCVQVQPELTTTDRYGDDSSNACSRKYRLRNDSERTCDNGMVCHFGICVDKDEGRSQCECDPGATGTRCTRKCCRDCGENGECFLNGTEEICNCHYNYTGPFCASLKPQEGPPEKVTWYWWIVGVCAAVLVLLIILLLVVPYVMWKYRVIMVMKIVYYFQGIEDDDDRKWDAFISYSQLDYKFVVHTLFPKLEQELGFKLIMHHRDFLGGETISNNIINAVKNSRRTVLVITPNFIKSEYTRFEYQVAQQEMLKRKHRIIPVLLDDISECKSSMDQTLKSILSSVTYLEWPHESDEKKTEKFWKRLQLSLPKKRQSSDTSKSNPSETLKSDDIKISIDSNKDNTMNGVIHSNKAYYSEPEADYDTINEWELEKNKNSTHKLDQTSSETDDDRYIKIDSWR